MEDRPDERAEDRRRRGPLGEENAAGDDSPQKGRESSDEPVDGGSEERTRPVRSESGETETRAIRTDEDSGKAEGEAGTRVIRPPGAEREMPYPRGYLEAADERQSRLRDMYGGIDWLASFLGFVFAVVAGAVLSPVVGVIVGSLGLTADLGGGSIGASVITGLIVLGVFVLVVYFLGGYVSGRLARFNGGLNGMITVLWGVAISVVVVFVGSFLPGAFFETVQNFVEASVLPAFSGLTEAGLIGVGILVGGLILALLGGFFGGRLGSRYHTRIDQTT